MSDQWYHVDSDPLTGRRIHYSVSDDILYVQSEYPVENLIDRNTFLLGASQGVPFRDGRRVASIPLNLFYSSLHQACLQDDQRSISRWLNDTDNRAFRTFRGTI